MAYVYAIVVNGVVRYVGKGCGRRAYRHVGWAKGVMRRRAAGQRVKAQRLYEKLIEAIKASEDIQVAILADHLTDAQAFDYEIETIAGLPIGQIWNDTPGGEGGSTPGRRVTAEQRAKVAASNKQAWSDPALLQAQSERMKANWLRPEYRERQKKIQRNAAREAIGEKARQRWADPAFREKMRTIMSSPEHRDKNRAAVNVRWAKAREQGQQRL